MFTVGSKGRFELFCFVSFVRSGFVRENDFNRPNGADRRRKTGEKSAEAALHDLERKSQFDRRIGFSNRSDQSLIDRKREKNGRCCFPFCFRSKEISRFDVQRISTNQREKRREETTRRFRREFVDARRSFFFVRLDSLFLVRPFDFSFNISNVWSNSVRFVSSRNSSRHTKFDGTKRNIGVRFELFLRFSWSDRHFCLFTTATKLRRGWLTSAKREFCRTTFE